MLTANSLYVDNQKIAAIRAGAPVFAEERVLDVAGIRLDKETVRKLAGVLGLKSVH